MCNMSTKNVPCELEQRVAAVGDAHVRHTDLLDEAELLRVWQWRGLADLEQRRGEIHGRVALHPERLQGRDRGVELAGRAVGQNRLWRSKNKGKKRTDSQISC